MTRRAKPPAPFDRLHLALLVNGEARALARAWPTVPKGLEGRKLARTWAKLAGVRIDAVRIHGPGLMSSGILTEDRGVAQEAKDIILGRTLEQLAPAAARGRR